MSDLGGHCMETLVEAFDAAQDDVPTLFVAWTVKGFGLPFAGHKDNHAGLMNPTQAHALRDAMGVEEGEEWEPLAGHRRQCTAGRRGADRAEPGSPAKSAPASFGQLSVPAIPAPHGEEQSTQAAFGRILLDLAKSGASARRPDRHHFARRHRVDQPRRLGEPARAVQAPRNGRCFRQGKDCVCAKMVWQQQRPAHRAGHRGIQSFPDVGRARACRAICSASGWFRSERSTTRSLPAASIASTTPVTRMPASCWSRPRPA